MIPIQPDPKLTEAIFNAIREVVITLQQNQIGHGNIKASNVFVEHSSVKMNYRARVLLSDPSFLQPSESDEAQGKNLTGSAGVYTPDNLGFANLMHLLVCGLYICYMPSGKALFHSKVKNSVYFRDIRHLLDNKPLKPNNLSLMQQQEQLCPSQMEQFPHFINLT
jgi:hypothetical protein